MTTIEQLKAQIQAMLAQLRLLGVDIDNGIDRHGYISDDLFEKENRQIEEYLSDFTQRSSTLITIASLLMILPFFDNEKTTSYFLIWIFPILVVAIGAYILSAKRLNFLPSVRKEMNFPPLTSEQINKIVKENYFNVLKFHRFTNIALITFFIIFISSFYLIFFIGFPEIKISILILILAVLVGILRDISLRKIENIKEMRGFLAAGAAPPEKFMFKENNVEKP